MNKIFLGKKIRKVVALSLLVSTIAINTEVQAEDLSYKLIGCIAAAGAVVTLYATQSHWWPCQDSKQGEKLTEEEDFAGFRSKIAAKRKQQESEVLAAEKEIADRSQKVEEDYNKIWEEMD